MARSDLSAAHWLQHTSRDGDMQLHYYSQVAHAARTVRWEVAGTRLGLALLGQGRSTGTAASQPRTGGSVPYILST